MLGLGTMAQEEPFHCSMSGRYSDPSGDGAKPTPTQTAPVTQSRETRKVLVPGVGIATTDQVDPCQRSAKAAKSDVSPMASQLLVLTHDTACNPPETPTGVETSVHDAPFQSSAKGTTDPATL
jgi:hypothetical protein